MMDVRPSSAGAAEAFASGAELPGLEVGPLTLADFVRWAAYQENWLRVHYDAAFARERMGLRDCIQSGHHRTALLARMVTDWLGPRGRLRRLAIRHTGPVYPGDVVRCHGRVRHARAGSGVTVIDLEVWATTQDGHRVSEGSAEVEVSGGAPRDEATR